ncbi:carbohydrate porin [Vibrio sp. ABG19]|uniref:carbohydrate porin n=1 Tax=Vibrio sp. ABG19 TaxID=2817385 RepID=UPI00249F6500|nr:carbohydrate porin [Vibrio sp. ABG19]WGY46642.1 carbohydrate porin [Vibrio sp. ABG19]
MNKIKYLPFAIAMVLSSGYVAAETNAALVADSFETRVDKLESEVERLNDFNFAGYFRAGWETSTNGDTNATTRFGERGNWAQGALGRFGNEYYGWYDFLFSQQFYDKEGISAKAVVMMDGSLNMQDSKAQITNGDGDTFTFSDMYLSTRGLISLDPKAEFWVGKHGIRNRVVKLFDWKYAMSNAGAGVGINDLHIGPGVLDLALTRYDYTMFSTTLSNTGISTNTNTLEMHYNDIPISDDLTLGLMTKYTMANKSSSVEAAEAAGTIVELKDAGMVGAVVRQKSNDGSFNEFVLQAANNGIATNMARIHGANPVLAHGGNYYSQQSGGALVRFVSQGENFIGDHFGIAHAIAVATSSDIYDPDALVAHSDINYVRTAIRPAYIWSNFNQTGMELGYFKQTSKSEGETLNESGYKATLFHNIKFGKGINSSPEIRFYASYLEALENDIDNVTFDGDDHQLKFGVTVDLWYF